MSEFLAIDRALDGEADTVEGRLADILANKDCIIRVDEYKLSESDKIKIINSLRIAHSIRQIGNLK